MTLGEKIQDLRRRSGMSQDTLAEKLDVSRQAVSKWERDEAVPETEKVIRIAQVFGVSTDHLLLDAPVRPSLEPRPELHRSRSAGDRLERFARRHGYKAGYVMIGIGAFLCLIALLVMILVPQNVSGFLDAAKIPESGWNSGLQVEGDVPQDVLDGIYGQAGAGMNSDFFGGDIFADAEDAYNQQVDQMNKTFSSGVRMITMLFGIPLLAVGVALIVAGIIVIRKGKRIAAETM